MSTGTTKAEEIVSRLERASGKPLRAMIEVSDRCNEVCVHCYQEQGKKGEMSTAEIKGVMDELATLGVLLLTISGGEATLRKDFLELVAHARARNFAVRVFTNGMTMTEALANELARLAVQTVEISLYSHRAEMHDFVTGVPGSFEKTVAGIRHLRTAGVDVHIKTPTMSVNEHELDSYIEFVSALGSTYSVDAGALMPREGGNLLPLAFNRSEATFVRIQHDPKLTPRKIAPLPQKPLSSPLCGAGANVHVEPNGELRPCTMLELNLGSAIGEGVGAARESKTFSELTALRWSDVHGCRDCDLRAYCSRCHAAAIAEAGDALAPYPTACAKARSRYEVDENVTPLVISRDGRGENLGPYRRISAHAFETIDDFVTTQDDALAIRLAWVRRAQLQSQPVAHAAPGALVQIRRPGARRGRIERIPGLTAQQAPHNSIRSQLESPVKP